jgi:hypothetical protein
MIRFIVMTSSLPARRFVVTPDCATEVAALLLSKSWLKRADNAMRHGVRDTDGKWNPGCIRAGLHRPRDWYSAPWSKHNLLTLAVSIRHD